MAKLGDKVRDKITGFTGTVTARGEYLYSGATCRVEALAHDGKSIETPWIDDARLEVLDA